MTYIIIALIIALAIAPLTHFLPSKQQRHQAALREAAALQGLFVEFRHPPGTDGGSARVPSSDTIYYGLRLRPSRGRERRRGAWLRDASGWRSSGERLPAPEPLQKLPAAVVAASVDEGSCGVYWKEKGGLETVAEIRVVLAEWAALLEER